MPLADDTAMFFGSSIMTFALPYGAFIVAAAALYYLFRAKHTSPKLKYLATSASVTSVTTREPGPVPAPPVTASAAEPAEVENPGEADTVAVENPAEPESEK